MEKITFITCSHFDFDLENLKFRPMHGLYWQELKYDGKTFFFGNKTLFAKSVQEFLLQQLENNDMFKLKILYKSAGYE